MLLKYKPKLEHVKIIPLIPVSAKAKEVKLTRNQIQLLPGTNEITDDEWLVIKDHIKRDIDSGIIVPIEKTVTKSKRSPDGTAKNLIEMPTPEAVSFVDNCNNPETIAKWYQEETRDEVRVRIIEKMKELKMDTPKLKSSGSDEDDDDSDKNTGKSIDEMSKDELIAYAKEKKIAITSSMSEKDMRDLIKREEAK